MSSEFVGNQNLDVPALITAAGPYGPALRAYVDRARQAFDGAQTPEEAAAPIVAALTAERPPLRVQTSQTARAFTGVKLADQDGSAVLGMTSGWIGGANA